MGAASCRGNIAEDEIGVEDGIALRAVLVQRDSSQIRKSPATRSA